VQPGVEGRLGVAALIAGQGQLEGHVQRLVRILRYLSNEELVAN
jgi:hypothetical protein